MQPEAVISSKATKCLLFKPTKIFASLGTVIVASGNTLTLTKCIISGVSPSFISVSGTYAVMRFSPALDNVNSTLPFSPVIAFSILLSAPVCGSTTAICAPSIAAVFPAISSFVLFP